MASRPWQTKSTLEKMYVEKEMSQSEIGEKLDCHYSTVGKWLDKHGIEKRNNYDWDKEQLREWYCDDKLSAEQIADELGCSRSAVYHKLDKYGIERRERLEALKYAEWPGEEMQGAPDWYYESQRKMPANYRMGNHGHMVWRISDINGYRGVCIHQLLMIAEGEDPEKVFSNGDYHVHHKNGIPWDNRVDNLELLPVGEHLQRHPVEA